MNSGFNDMKKEFSLDVEEDFLFYYYGKTCVHCIKFKPVINEYLEKDNALPIYALDVEDKSLENIIIDFIEKDGLELEGTPTLYHIKDGKVVGEGLVGVQELSDMPVKQ